LNILHVVETLEVGGLERAVLSLAQEQLGRGHTVAVACLFRAGALASHARSMSIDVIECGKRPGLDIAAATRMRAIIRNRGVGVLHSHNPVSHYYAVAASLGLHGLTRISTRHGMGTLGQSFRRDVLYRLAMTGTDHTVTVCKAARARFVSQHIIPSARSSTIPNGVPLSRFMSRNAARRTALIAQCGLQDAEVLYGTVGRMTDAKDPENLVEAFAEVLRDRPRDVLLFVGDGPMRDQTQRRCSELGLLERVRFLGTRDDVPDLMSSFDVFVLPSKTEGYPLVLVEAAASALPCIATDVGGNSEIVAEGITGTIVQPSDPAALARAMRTLAASTTLRASYGAAAARWATKFGSIEAMADAYDLLYRGESASRQPLEQTYSAAARSGSKPQ
jgi:glycosyltransferase involved in cell wall biosynthesis